MSHLSVEEGVFHTPSSLNSQINQNQHNNVVSLNLTIKELAYIPYSGCVLDHILCNTQLSNLEKLKYILADSLSLIRKNKGKERNITLSAKQWAKKLDCSVAEIFSMQQSLEEKGYFEISRGRNKSGKNMKNVITPILPDSVFMLLANTPNKSNIDTSSASHLTSPTYIPNLEGKRAYLDRTKMFIKLNYDLLSLISSYEYLANYSKVMWLGLYSTGYRYYLKHRDCVKNATDLNEIDKINASDGTNYYGSYSLTTTYQELQDKYSCNKSVISKTLKELETLGFINRKRFFVKNDDDEDNLHDKSIWRITVTLPHTIQQQLMATKNRVQPAEESVISNSDPYVSNSRQYINKYFKNSKDSDSIDSENNFFEKTADCSPKNLSELSVSYKNFTQKKEDHSFCLPQTNTINNSELNNSQRIKSAKVTTVDGSKTISAKKSTDPIQLDNKTTTEPNKQTKGKPTLKTNQTKLTNTVKFSPNAKLKDWYPLSPQDVDRLNSKSAREFSTNFVNELLLKFHSKYPDRIFPTKNHMLSYMSKALHHELHQAPLVNHETFRFAKKDPESIAEKQREKYLAEVEDSSNISYESQFRRKIAAMFESKLAYQLLTQAKFTTTVQEQRSGNNEFDDKFDDQCLKTASETIIQEANALSDEILDKQQLNIMQNNQNNSFIVKLNQDIQLSNLQRQTLENAIVSVYGHVDITYNQVYDNYRKLDKLQPRKQYEIYLEELDPNSTWYKIRTQLIERFGSDVDKAWFSKLTAEENLQNKALTLFAPSNFMRDWIKNKYQHKIQPLAEKLGCQFVELVTKEQFLSHTA